ncbi:ASCH domain-containing protein [Streptomyces sp. NPDC003011]
MLLQLPTLPPDVRVFTPVLTVRQPFAWAIVAGLKDVENRTWETPHRGRLYIHAAGRVHRETLELAATFGLTLPADAVFSAIIGHVTLDDVVTGSSSPWAMPDHRHWRLSDPQEYDPPVPCAGRLSLWSHEPARPAPLDADRPTVSTADR